MVAALTSAITSLADPPKPSWWELSYPAKNRLETEEIISICIGHRGSGQGSTISQVQVLFPNAGALRQDGPGDGQRPLSVSRGLHARQCGWALQNSERAWNGARDH